MRIEGEEDSRGLALKFHELIVLLIRKGNKVYFLMIYRDCNCLAVGRKSPMRLEKPYKLERKYIWNVQFNWEESVH